VAWRLCVTESEFFEQTLRDEPLADLALDLRAEDRLCIDGDEAEGVRTVCSLGIV
jgi:hypothetical protein